MALKIGSSASTVAKVGATAVAKIYLGTTVVFTAS